MDDGSELSSGDEALASSDFGSPDITQAKKRGRPRLLKEEIDIDETGELKIDKYGRLLGGTGESVRFYF